MTTTDRDGAYSFARDARPPVSLFEPQNASLGSDATPFRVSPPWGWEVRTTAPWTFVDVRDSAIPEQGWKIHVSATEETAHQVLSIASAIAFNENICFKFLTNLSHFRASNSKYAERAASGKFIALYPSRYSQLENALTKLDLQLAGLQGPYILSDFKYGSGPIFVRYGAFKELTFINESGEARPAIRDPQGQLTEDCRLPQLTIPHFAAVPSILRKHIDERLAPSDDSLSNLLEGFRMVKPMHFSNGGGVYLLSRTSDDAGIVMKEGRPHAGLDFRGNDARARIHQEYASLRALAHTNTVPLAHEIRHSGGHAFLFEDYVNGDNLFTWVAKNYPFSYHLGTDHYTQQALELLGNISDAVAKIHAAGYAVMDLQPTNIIVHHDCTVHLIDLESCCPLEIGNGESFIGTPGFVPPYASTPLERDQYALLQVALHLFYPLAPLCSISDSVTDVAYSLIKLFFLTQSC